MISKRLPQPLREPPSPADGAEVWGTFYDIRRYGGLQIYLRAVLGGASLVLSSPGESVADHFARLAAAGVTHLSGTPSQWRRALMMAPETGMIACHVTCACPAKLPIRRCSMRSARTFPHAAIGHAYASTEAGVAFDVNDGIAGFPSDYIGTVRNGVGLKILDGTLRIRSLGVAKGYVDGEPLVDAAGFVDTGDILERKGERFYFAGRRGGIINVGGLKVHPEEVSSAGDQPAPARAAHVAGARPAKSRHRLDRGCRCGAQGRRPVRR